MKISDFINNPQPYIDECVEPDKTEHINFKYFMKVQISHKPKKIHNQKPSDIIKKSYTYEKKVEREWEELLRRIF